MALSQQLQRKRILLRERDVVVSEAVELRLIAAATVLESQDAIRRARSMLQAWQRLRRPQAEAKEHEAAFAK